MAELEKVDAGDYCYYALSKYQIEGETPSRQFYERVKASAKKVASTPPLLGEDGKLSANKEEQLESVH